MGYGNESLTQNERTQMREDLWVKSRDEMLRETSLDIGLMNMPQRQYAEDKTAAFLLHNKTVEENQKRLMDRADALDTRSQIMNKFRSDSLTLKWTKPRKSSIFP